MNNYLHAYIMGLVILVIAIILNLIANTLKITMWFTYLPMIKEVGFFKASIEVGILSILFMYVIYPLLLGLSAYITISYLK